LDGVGKKLREKDRLIDEQRSKRALRDTLPPDEDAQVVKILRTRGVISKCAREQVSDQDIARLGPAQWLNDEIINFYGAMINARSDDRQAKVKHGQVLNAFYLSTFFWEKLVKDGYEKGRLAKWTKKVDIFAKDIVLIPVNHKNLHWTAAAINFKLKRIESYDSMNMAGADVCQVRLLFFLSVAYSS
jgi:sentrin-specific protease 1